MEELNLKDVIEVLLKFNIKHYDEFPSTDNVAGLCDMDSKIYLDDSYKVKDRRKTIIHEILHARDSIYGNKPFSEKEIDKMANMMYEVLYEK